MKKLLVTALMLCWPTAVVHAEITGYKGPVEYLIELPKVPGGGCAVTAETIDEFGREFFPVKSKLDNEVAERRRAIKKWQESNSKKMQENAVDMPGFQGKSQAEMKKMSKAEKKKMAEQMMEDKFGVSMQELKDQKKAQRAGKTSANVDWAKAMAGEQQANDLMKSKGQLETDKRKITDNIKLAKEQESLTKSTLGIRTMMLEKISELEKDEKGLELKKQLEKQEKTLDEMMSDGISCKDLDAQSERIATARGSYCSYMAPKYLKALKNYRTSIQTSLPRHLRLDEISSEIQKNQVGVGLPHESIGLNGLETVQDYARYLGKAYKFNDRDPSAPKGSHCDGDAGTISK